MGSYFSAYSDDEKITLDKGKTSNEQSVFSASFKSSQDFYLLDSNSPTEVIGSLELEGLTSGENSRVSIDLVLVIDISGSMRGEKLELVQKTMHFLLTQVQDNDRVSIITFNGKGTKLCGLVKGSAEGKQKLAKIIDSLYANGDTNLVEGLSLGLKILSNRKIVNTSSAILLLTDGIDSQKTTSVQRAKIAIEDIKVPDQYTIHTFGYGKNHDAQLLNSISDLKNGGFYYIEQFNNISEAFANCLGEIMSVLFDSIQVNLVTQACPAPFRLKKVFSDSGDNSFPVSNLIRGMKKEVIFIIELDYCEFPQHQIEIQPIKASISYRDVKTEAIQVNELFLSLNIKKEGAPTLDIDCLTNYFRFKTAEAIKLADEFAKINDLEKARNEIQACIDTISNSVIAESQLGKVFIEDLQKSKKNFESLNEYLRGGQIDNMKRFKNHLNKRGEEIDAYQNSYQKNLIKSSKKFFNKL